MKTRGGIVLNTLGAILAGLAIAIPETITTAGGTMPLRFLAPFAAAGFVVRIAGLAYARRKGMAAMPWGPRVLSWILFGVMGVLLGLTGSAAAIATLAAFVVLDAAAGMTKHGVEATPVARRERTGIWKRVKLPLLITLYLTLTAVIHFSVSLYLPFGVLVTWSMLAFGFALLLRFMVAGPKANEIMLRAPVEHRRHERREEVIIDPQRRRADDILLTLRAHGDAGPLLDLVTEAARTADFTDAEVESLKQRILATFARAGTRRDQDVHAALAEVERSLSPKHRETFS